MKHWKRIISLLLCAVLFSGCAPAAVEDALAQTTREQIEQTLLSAMLQQMRVEEGEVKRYLQEMADEEKVPEVTAPETYTASPK